MTRRTLGGCTRRDHQKSTTGPAVSAEDIAAIIEAGNRGEFGRYRLTRPSDAAC